MKNSEFILAAIVAALVVPTTSQTTNIVYKLSARNIPAGKKVFAEVNKDRSFYCRTAAIESQTPIWSELCEIQHPTENRLYVEARHQRTLFPDESLGWSYFDLIGLTQTGTEVESDIANGGNVNGKMKVTVVHACDASEPNCVSKYLQTLDNSTAHLNNNEAR